jgi:hypothetical protein
LPRSIHQSAAQGSTALADESFEVTWSSLKVRYLFC